MDALHQIVYVSSAIKLLSPDELQSMLTVARARNAGAEVTGVLLYSHGNFMQHIEGPQSALLAIYASIVRDPRHRDINELVHEPVAQREFGDWTMACSAASAATLLSLSNASWRSRDSVDSPGRELLRKVWRGLA